MSKLKLYRSSEELSPDLATAREKLIEYGSMSSFSNMEAVRMRYVTDFDAILKAKDLNEQYFYFERFSNMLDNKFANEEWTDKNKRNEKDLIKYQLLCAMELKALSAPLVPNSKAAAKYLQEIKQHGRQESDFRDFIEEYKKEAESYSVGFEGYKELEKINNQIKATFVRLNRQMPSPENNKLAEQIVKDNPKILDYAVGDVGKRSWLQFFGDMWRNIKEPVVNLFHKIMNSVHSSSATRERQDSPPPLPKTAPPPIPSISDMLPTYAPPPVPNYPPPPIPKDVPPSVFTTEPPIELGGKVEQQVRKETKSLRVMSLDNSQGGSTKARKFIDKATRAGGRKNSRDGGFIA